MIGDVLKNILDGEAQAARILSDAEDLIRKIEKKTQIDIENMKAVHVKMLNEKIKLSVPVQAPENKTQNFEIKIDDAKIESAKKYIVSNLIGGEK